MNQLDSSPPCAEECWISRQLLTRILSLSPHGLLDGRLNFQACLDFSPVSVLVYTLGEGGEVVGPSQLVPERLRVLFFILRLDLLPTGECSEHRHEQHPQDNLSPHAAHIFHIINSAIETINAVHHTKSITASCLAMSGVDGA